MRYLHLDSEYRRRWQEYHLADGSIKDSRQINFHRVKWSHVVKVVTVINNYRHEQKIESSSHKGFMCFRWGGREHIEKKIFKPIHIWSVGWTDGKNHYMKDYDFYTGKFIKQYVRPFKAFKEHVHKDLNLGEIK